MEHGEGRTLEYLRDWYAIKKNRQAGDFADFGEYINKVHKPNNQE